ncbi:MAG: hypothetical protein ACLVKO_05915 [Dysgonomonas sp.]
MTIGKTLANIFSAVLSPFLMPFYNVVLLFAYTTFYEIHFRQILYYIIPVLLFSFIVPVSFLFVLKKLRMISGYSIPEKKERILPYLMTCFANSMLFYYFYSSGTYFWFLGIIAIPVVISLVGFIINLFWKISAHMMGIGGLIGTVMAVCFYIKGLNPFILFIILFILAGCLGVSRVYLKRDTAAQVYGGFAVGFALAFLCILGSIFYMIGQSSI